MQKSTQMEIDGLNSEMIVTEKSGSHHSVVTGRSSTASGDVLNEEEKQRYRDILREKLPELKNIEGFPIGKDEDILALSDPPYYTACPNPFIDEFIRKWQWEKHLKHHAEGMRDTDGALITPESFDAAKCTECTEIDRNYHREPYAADVSEGKNHPIYNAHSYHTKVPHKAIMRYILHYTEPGDIVFDGFCGTGMTGVAAQMCGDEEAVRELGFEIDKKGIIYEKIDEKDDEESDAQTDWSRSDIAFTEPVMSTRGAKLTPAKWRPVSRLGARKAVLNDLSPAATFIAYNYNTPVDVREFEKEAKCILKEVENECGWMYETQHSVNGNVQLDIKGNPVKGRINYTVWSDVFVCPYCSQEIIFWKAAVDKENGEVKKSFPCYHCGGEIKNKAQMERAWEVRYDRYIEDTIKQAKQVPVLINYSVEKKRFEKEPDEFDIELIKKIEEMDIPYWFPKDRMPEGYNTAQPMKSHGITHVHHFYTKRNLWVLGAVFNRLMKSEVADSLLWSFTGIQNVTTKMNRFTPTGMFSKFRALIGTLYVAAMYGEMNIFDMFKNKSLLRIKPVLTEKGFGRHYEISTSDAGDFKTIPQNSIDYIFSDPPFGANIMYSELNFIWEAWLKVATNNLNEALVNKTQNKKLYDYQQLMEKCFCEYYRLIKPGKWVTIEFSNTSPAVWYSIQESLQKVGFVLSNVATLDKQFGSFKAVMTTATIKEDLIVSVYKPWTELQNSIAGINKVGEESAWKFLDMHLKMLPLIREASSKAQAVEERTPRSLFDRMVAYHVQRGLVVPFSSSEFQEKVVERYPERDGMVFLPEQVPVYERKKLRIKEFMELSLFIEDEKSAIEWLRQRLMKKPQTYADIVSDYMKELQHIEKREKMPELSEMLEQNFLEYSSADYDKGEVVPKQIISYLRSNYKKYREIPEDSPEVKKEAKGRWYVPDPNKAADLEKIREKALMKEFFIYAEQIKTSKKRLKQFRMEALRCGFNTMWQSKDYKTIAEVGDHLPENIIQEDQALLMFYDNAKIRIDLNS